jgi:hypothetical protein
MGEGLERTAEGSSRLCLREGLWVDALLPSKREGEEEEEAAMVSRRDHPAKAPRPLASLDVSFGSASVAVERSTRNMSSSRYTGADFWFGEGGGGVQVVVEEEAGRRSEDGAGRDEGVVEWRGGRGREPSLWRALEDRCQAGLPSPSPAVGALPLELKLVGEATPSPPLVVGVDMRGDKTARGGQLRSFSLSLSGPLQRG